MSLRTHQQGVRGPGARRTSIAALLLLLAAPLVGLGAHVTAVHAALAFFLLLLGVLFLALGFVGEYVGRIYNEVRQRPRFVVRSVHASQARGMIEPEPPGRDQVRPLREVRDDDGSA